MKLKTAVLMTAAGVGGAFMYQQIKNGNMKKMVSKLKSKEVKMLDDLEDMM